MGRLYIYLHGNHKNQMNVGEYTIHGWYGQYFTPNFNPRPIGKRCSYTPQSQTQSVLIISFPFPFFIYSGDISTTYRKCVGFFCWSTPELQTIMRIPTRSTASARVWKRNAPSPVTETLHGHPAQTRIRAIFYIRHGYMMYSMYFKI